MPVLIWADVLAAYAMWMLLLYLTNVWGSTFTSAAAIINVFWGLVSIMRLPMQYIVDTFMGNYWMLTFSSLAYSAVSISLSVVMQTCCPYNK